MDEGIVTDRQVIERTNKMAEESLDPETFEMWCQVCNSLYRIRNSLDQSVIENVRRRVESGADAPMSGE